MKNFLLVAYLCVAPMALFSQSINFEKGEYIGLNHNRAKGFWNSDSTGNIAQDFSAFHTLLFMVIEDGSTNGMVHVKSFDGDFYGWIREREAEKHPIPDHLSLTLYDKNMEVLRQIENNFMWHQWNNNTRVAGDHAGFYFHMARMALQSDSLQKAVVYFTKSVAIIPKSSTYIGRAFAKHKLSDYAGAINDCNKALSMISNPPTVKDKSSFFRSQDFTIDLIQPYGLRGFCYMKQKNYSMAISDLTTAISKTPLNPEWYIYRGICKWEVGQKSGSCLDWSKAGELGEAKAYEYIRDYCQ